MGHVLDIADSSSEMSSEKPPPSGSLPDLDEESPRGRKRFRSGELAGGGSEKGGLDSDSVKQVSLIFPRVYFGFPTREKAPLALFPDVSPSRWLFWPRRRRWRRLA